MKKGNYVDHRLIKIIDEMLVFLYSLATRNIKMEIKKEEEYSEIIFDAKLGEPIEAKRLKKIEKLLSAPRQHEMEEFCWGLTGNDTTPSTELGLVGMMIDEHETIYNEEDLTFYLRLRRDRV